MVQQTAFGHACRQCMHGDWGFRWWEERESEMPQCAGVTGCTMCLVTQLL